MSATEAITAAVDRDRLVTTAKDLVAISSPTGSELGAVVAHDEVELPSHQVDDLTLAFVAPLEAGDRGVRQIRFGQ